MTPIIFNWRCAFINSSVILRSGTLRRECSEIGVDSQSEFYERISNRMLESLLTRFCVDRRESVFSSLSGKAVDMKCLDGDQKLTYSEEVVPAIPTAKVYKSSDGKISLYQCDLYKFSRILDRGSLVAINPRDREKCAALIMSLMDKDCRYHLDTFFYTILYCSPFDVPDEEVNRLFRESCGTKFISSSNALPEVKDKEWGLDVFIERVHRLTPKAS
uniref:Uncharacterized protein n=1 Tax=Oncorhynchus kisutch TaxID=8019 RepID=A0A8C7LAL4_ONCKI